VVIEAVQGASAGAVARQVSPAGRRTSGARIYRTAHVAPALRHGPLLDPDPAPRAARLAETQQHQRLEIERRHGPRGAHRTGRVASGKRPMNAVEMQRAHTVAAHAEARRDAGEQQR
jgi:hypothetical protein